MLPNNAKAKGQPEKEMTGSDKSTLVVLEPYESLREALELILGGDYRLLFARTFDEALGQIQDQRTALFILDVTDKEIGFKMIEETRRRFPDLTILVTSVDSDWPFKERVLKAVKTGVRFQDKPYESKELSDRIHLILNGDPGPHHRYVLTVPKA